jgi:DNA helicase HerA-like ATPase
MHTERSPNDPIDNLAIGTIIEVDGTHIVVELDPGIEELTRVFGGEIYPIGQFGSILKIHSGKRLIYGYVSRLQMRSEYDRTKGLATGGSTARILEADLFGEAEWILDSETTPPEWKMRFDRGVSNFPLPRQIAHLTPRHELAFIWGRGDGPVIQIGEHVGTGGTPCYADLNELLGKHSVVLGSTGAGKSCAVAAIVHAVLDRGINANLDNWCPQIVILDPHNEYQAAFSGSERRATDEGSLKLPYWLFDLHETILLFIGKTEFVATSQANIVKAALLAAREGGARALGIDPRRISVDSPIPYKLGLFRQEVDAQRPSGQDKKQQEPYNSIISKLDVLESDARMQFLMSPWDGSTDNFASIVSQFLGSSHPIRIIDFSGVPNEVAGAASAVIARTLFSVKLWQSPQERAQNPVLLICEEAHRYVPDTGEAQYEAAQEAIRRIAKEGRKYGIGLMLVSQRPSEVDSTVLSQCNSWVVLRISNDKDRDHVRSMLPDSLTGLTKILSGLRRREAIFVGQAAMLPSRILIRDLPKDKQPRSNDIDFDLGWRSEPPLEDGLRDIGVRWRVQRRSTETGS